MPVSFVSCLREQDIIGELSCLEEATMAAVAGDIGILGAKGAIIIYVIRWWKRRKK